MRKALNCLGVLVCIAALNVPTAARADDPKPFEDVKPDHWAYQAVTDLNDKGFVTGYPDGYFSGQRILTRYEFAVALKRTLDKVAPVNRKAGPTPPVGPNVEPGNAAVTTVELDELRRLTESFATDLASLGVKPADVHARLDGLSRSVAESDAHRRRTSSPNRDFAVGIHGAGQGVDLTGSGGPLNAVDAGPFTLFRRSRGFQPDPYTDVFGATSFGGAAGTERFTHDGFRLQSSLGNGTIKLFGGSYGNVPGTGYGPYGGGPGISALGSGLQASRSRTLNGRPLYIGGGSEFGIVGNYGTTTPWRVFGVHGDFPLFKYGELGLTLLDFSPAGYGPGSLESPEGSGYLYGANLRINPSGRFEVSGEASKTVTQRALIANDGRSNDDNSAYLLNLGYNSGPVTGAAGYQYYDPSYVAPSSWNKIGSWYNPTNVQGPFARVDYRISDSVAANLGVDYLTGARNRPGYGGFTQGSSVIRGLAGVRYHFSKQFELSAQYEGVLYDMSSAISASGLRAKPVEQYITLGAGLNLSGNTVLRLAYQIINVQDAGNGFGLAPAFGGNNPGGTANTNVITTQFSVHF